MTKKEKFKISNRVLYTLITVGIFIILAVGAYALTGGIAPNPGHLITDIAPPSGCTSGQFLEFSGGTWICATPASTQYQWSNSGSNIYYNLGNVGVGKVPSYPLDVNGITNAQSYYLNGVPINVSTGPLANLPLEPITYTDSNGNWQWTQAPIFKHEAYNAPAGYNFFYDTVELNPTRPVLGIMISASNIYSDGVCAAGVNGFFWVASTSDSYMSIGPLSINGDIYPSEYPRSGLTSISPTQFIINQLKPGQVALNTGYQGAINVEYNKPAGLTYIPPGQNLTIQSVVYTPDNTGYSIACNVSVLYGDYSINPISAADQAAADQALIISECGTAGGTWINNVCRFNGNDLAHDTPVLLCPANWVYGGWTTTTSNSVNNGICSGARSICTTGGHAWSSSPIENCSYTNESSYMGSSGWVCNDVPNTLYATVTQAGCLQEFPQ